MADNDRIREYEEAVERAIERHKEHMAELRKMGVCMNPRYEFMVLEDNEGNLTLTIKVDSEIAYTHWYGCMVDALAADVACLARGNYNRTKIDDWENNEYDKVLKWCRENDVMFEDAAWTGVRIDSHGFVGKVEQQVLWSSKGKLVAWRDRAGESGKYLIGDLERQGFTMEVF